MKFVPASDLVLLDIADVTWANAVGAPADLYRGPRFRAQKWSREIYEAYPDIHGIYYPSAMHSGGWNIALYERAIDALPAVPEEDTALVDMLDDLQEVARKLGWAS